MPSNIDELMWLHDSDLIQFLYDSSDKAGRSIMLIVDCHPDCRHALWQGKRLVIAAVDVAICKYAIWGWVMESETIDSVRSGVSKTVREELRKAEEAGLRLPDCEFTIAFHSGSELEVVCRNVTVELTS